MEHRWGDRRTLILPVRLLGPGRLCARGWLTNISLSGAYVQTLATLATLSRITLEVDQPSKDDLLQMRARVIRQGPGGVGVEWEQLALGTLTEIERTAVDQRGSEAAHWMGMDP